MSESELGSEDASNDPKTTGLVEVHTNIGREGVIVELRRADHERPWEDDMSHLTDEKARELRDQLNTYLGEPGQITLTPGELQALYGHLHSGTPDLTGMGEYYHPVLRKLSRASEQE